MPTRSGSQLAGFGDYIGAAMPTWDCPGAAVAVLRGAEVVHQSVHGVRDLQDHAPLTADTRFPLASVTKSFAAMSLALLVDDGKLSWDTPVREYMPEFVLKDAYATQHVTVRDMLSHRTGLPRHDLAAWRLDLPPAEFVKRLRHLEFSATFREKYQYNNLMYNSVAHLVETLAGVKWASFVTSRIFEPLGMTASNFSPEPPQPGQPVAKGYRAQRDESGAVEQLIETPLGSHTELSPGAAGALFSTLADLTRWLEVHVNDGVSGGHRLVSTANLKQMHLPHTIIPAGGVNEALFGNTIFTYGLGWMIEPYKGHTLVHHGGNVEGHSVIVAFVPGAELAVVVLCNLAGTFLRNALLYEAIDRGLGLPATDWSARFHSFVDPQVAGQSRSKATTAEERLTNAPPSRPLEAYEGEFEAAGYPDLAVRLEGDRLQASTLGSLPFTDVTHYHYDVFEWDLGHWDQRLKLRYLSNDQGELYAVSVPIEPAVPNVTFRRKEPTLAPHVLESLVGTYLPPVEGAGLTISSAEGKLYVTPAGQATIPLRCYKVADNQVGFTWERARLDFELEDGVARRLHFKAEGMTLVAVRAE
ncbi:MAG: serine hydrolase [Trueperaceae bacterium]